MPAGAALCESRCPGAPQRSPGRRRQQPAGKAAAEVLRGRKQNGLPAAVDWRRQRGRAPGRSPTGAPGGSTCGSGAAAGTRSAPAPPVCIMDEGRRGGAGQGGWSGGAHSLESGSVSRRAGQQARGSWQDSRRGSRRHPPLTCSLPSRVCARWLKMSRMRAVRSHSRTSSPSALSRLRSWPAGRGPGVAASSSTASAGQAVDAASLPAPGCAAGRQGPGSSRGGEC